METPIEILKQRLATLRVVASAGKGFSARKRKSKLAIPQFEKAISDLERAQAEVDTGENNALSPDVVGRYYSAVEIEELTTQAYADGCSDTEKGL